MSRRSHRPTRSPSCWFPTFRLLHPLQALPDHRIWNHLARRKRQYFQLSAVFLTFKIRWRLLTEIAASTVVLLLSEHSLRFTGETDSEFLARAKRSAIIARLLVEACLANRRVRESLASTSIPEFSEERLRKLPIVRLEYEQAIAIGDLGSTLSATRSKHWGDGPWVMPLEPDDWFYKERITYLYCANSLYNRRFEQRRRMKELLGKEFRSLVGHAQHKRSTKAIFLQYLTDSQADVIRQRLRCEPGEFWRAAQGRMFLDLPPRQVQLEFDFDRVQNWENDEHPS